MKLNIRMKEMNFAIFFLCEIEVNFGYLRRNLLDNLLENPKFKLIFFDKIIKNQKFR